MRVILAKFFLTPWSYSPPLIKYMRQPETFYRERLREFGSFLAHSSSKPTEKRSTMLSKIPLNQYLKAGMMIVRLPREIRIKQIISIV